MPAFELVRRFGVVVILVANLDCDAVYVHAHNVGLVRAELDPEGLRWAEDWLLSEVTAGQSAHRP